ncbi:hypothetical protein SAICODRAFT_9723 [Saitoella complicata NRRL Y-17804]|nr:uncharacterized protein SAICODRAFT_9723 [Saitoella complicata NRRL Y-17804]ODQ50761.1 hypothetical protein SAICODRAFT_9723 [Saitoella complicata NRRL Y-17804]
MEENRMLFSPAAPLKSTTTGIGSIVDHEMMDKRQSAQNVLNSWDQLAMHSLATGESIAQVRLRMKKAMIGLK